MLKCLTCGSSALADRGRIFHDTPALVAGVPADMGSAKYHLVHCAACQTMQKSPSPPIEELMRCYRAAPADNWGHDVDTAMRQVPLLSDILRQRQPQGGRLLDIGCANGAIAAAIEGPWAKFGIEPSEAAAALAEERGVQIVAAAVDKATTGARFNGILALDLVEHITTPLKFMAEMRSLLVESGTLVILTGDTDSRSWRIFGSRHWYCSLPEHVIFFNESSLSWLAQRTNFVIDDVIRIPHLDMPLYDRFNQSTRVALWRAARGLRGFGIPRLRAWATEHRSPYWNAETDHMVAVLRAT